MVSCYNKRRPQIRSRVLHLRLAKQSVIYTVYLSLPQFLLVPIQFPQMQRNYLTVEPMQTSSP